MFRSGVLLIVFSLLLLISCTLRTPIQVGFVATLSGPYSAFSIEAKNGVMLAVEDINDSGGINHRKIEVIYRDDENDPLVAREVVSDFIDREIKIIIGHMTSSMTMASVDLLEGTDVIMISPTTSTDSLAGKNDNFYRVTEASSLGAERLADFMIRELKPKSIAAVFDLQNEAYARGWIESLVDRFVKSGVLKKTVIGFDGKIDDDFEALADRLLEGDPDVISMALGSRDSALLCQQIRKKNESVQLGLSAWAKNSDFLRNSGVAAEGLFFTDVFNPDSEDTDYINFRENYLDRFGYEPSLSGSHSYETLLVLKSALTGRKSKNSMKESLDYLKLVKGLQGSFRFNQYGDVRREHYIITVKEGEYLYLVDK